MSKTIEGWHFTSTDRKISPGDGRRVVAGETLAVPRAALRRWGLHASTDILEALQRAPGPYLWRVRLGGAIESDGALHCGTESLALWGFDATDVLRQFARRCALDVAHLWDMPAIVRQYLETGNESIRDAAWEATGTATRRATWTAARAAAKGASRAAADASAWNSWSAAWATARAAAWAAGGGARDAQRETLLTMVEEATK